MDILLVAVGLVGLFFGGNLFVQAAVRLAGSFSISALVIGLTVVAIGTSMPEMIVSVGAATTGSSDIALGNVIGSNIANIGLIIGLVALIKPFGVNVRMIRREIPLLIGVTAMSYVLLFDGRLSQADGVLLVVGAVAYLGWMVMSACELPNAGAQPEQTDPPASSKRIAEGIRLIVGLLILLAGARLTVDGAIELARTVGISELVIGITLVALGTSLPELVTSVVAARRGENDIALGNVVGSNIANLLLILGVTAVIQPIPVADHVIRLDALVMAGFALLLIPFVLDRQISRREGAMFVTAYMGYTLFLFLVRDVS